MTNPAELVCHPVVRKRTAPARVRPWQRLLTPSFADFLAISLLGWLFLAGPFGWQGLLGDGDTGWHIRTGEFILDNRTVPAADMFSYTKPAEPWFAWEWLSAVAMGAMHRAAGLKGVVIWAAAMVVAFCAVLFRHMIWRGSNLFVALLISLLAVGASSIHYLARPHLFTLVLLPCCLWLLERDRRQRTRAIWLLIPVAAVWTNLHGGFLSLVACLGLLSAGSLLERRYADARRYGILAAACGSASILNPYGYQLHLHMWEYLRSDWIRRVVVEFRSPSFRDENVFQFEILMFVGLGVAALMAARGRLVEPLWILFWSHQALTSVRHITVFAAVAAPIIAAECSIWWDWWVAGARRSSVRGICDSLAKERLAGCRWNSVWVAVPFLALLVVNEPLVKWPRDFPEKLFPVDVIARHETTLAHARVFTADDWADYLIYRHYPDQRVFFDGRSDFYGPELGNQYLRMSLGRPDWKELLDQHRIDVVLSPTEWGLASLLKQDADWKILEDSGKAILFLRRPR